MHQELVIVSTYPQKNSGISNYVRHFIPKFEEAGFNVRAETMYFMLHPTRNWRWLLLALKQMRRPKQVTLIQFTPTSSGPGIILFLLLVRALRGKIIVESHEVPSTYEKYLHGRLFGLPLFIFRGYEKSIVALATHYVVHTKLHREELRQRGSKKEILVVPLAVYDPSDALPTRNPKYWAFYGQISPKKGVDILLKAYQTRPPGFFPPLLIIGPAAPGQEAYVQELKTMVTAAYAENIRFQGFVEEANKAKIFSEIGLMIFPYRWITQSAALGEACLHGIPYLASDLDFFKDFQQEYHCGYLFPAGSIEGLTGALEKAVREGIRITDADFQKPQRELSLNTCRDRFKELFSP